MNENAIEKTEDGFCSWVMFHRVTALAKFPKI